MNRAARQNVTGGNGYQTSPSPTKAAHRFCNMQRKHSPMISPEVLNTIKALVESHAGI
jgi:hypothetical protein